MRTRGPLPRVGERGPYEKPNVCLPFEGEGPAVFDYYHLMTEYVVSVTGANVAHGLWPMAMAFFFYPIRARAVLVKLYNFSLASNLLWRGRVGVHGCLSIRMFMVLWGGG